MNKKQPLWQQYSRRLCAAAVTAIIGLCLAACGGADDPAPQKKLSGIAVTTPPDKTGYITGEAFDPAGMAVTASYSDKSTAPVTGYTWAPLYFDTDGIEYVTVSFRGKAATVAVTVSAPERTLSGIAVTTPPDKTEYALGEAFDPEGMVVTASYSNGDSEPASGYTWDPLSFGAAGAQTVTVSFGGETAALAVTVYVYGIALSAGGAEIDILTFPAAEFGYAEQGEETITVANTGERATGGLSIALDGSEDFTISPETLSSIAAEGSGAFTVKPNAGLAAGTYTATVTVSGGNVSASFDVSFTVSKAAGTWAEHAAVSARFAAGLTLAGVPLSAGYAWKDGSVEITGIGEDSYPAIFTRPGGSHLPAEGEIAVTVAKGFGAGLPAPELAERTSGSITVEAIIAPTGQDVEYGIADADDADEAGWQEEPVFEGLSPNTPYYIFARAVANGYYEEGEPSGSLAATTQAIEAFAVSFSQLQDGAPALPGIEIRLIGNASETAKTVTVEGEYERIAYYFNGEPIAGDAISGQGRSFTATPGFFGNSTGAYYITVEVETGGRRYSNIIAVTVRL